MKTISRYIMTLALLLTAVTGAWAQATFEVKEITSDMVPAAWEGDNTIVSPEDLATLGITFFEVTKAQASAWADYPKEGTVRLLYAYSTGFSSVDWYNGTPDGDSWNFKRNQIYVANATGYRYFVTVPSTAEPPITVEPVEGKTNEWTFAMPGSDVVLTPQYAPAAQLAENGAPAAVSGLEIAADAAIITAGQSAQGTLLYAVGTSETEKPALTAFAATLPNAKDQTAAGNYYVWYYIQGQDTPQGQEPTAENTFNDSEIMGPVKVELLTNEHTLNIKQSPNITVTVAGTAKTPTDDKVTPVTTGQEVKIKAKEGYKFRKVEVKKGAKLLSITISGVTVYYAEGESWADAIKRDENKDLGLFIREGNRVHHPTYGQLVDSNTQPVLPDAKINANESYRFIK